MKTRFDGNTFGYIYGTDENRRQGACPNVDDILRVGCALAEAIRRVLECYRCGASGMCAAHVTLLDGECDGWLALMKEDGK